jgi:hypothetical protein
MHRFYIHRIIFQKKFFCVSEDRFCLASRISHLLCFFRCGQRINQAVENFLEKTLAHVDFSIGLELNP